jgi:hypothetical protein
MQVERMAISKKFEIYTSERKKNLSRWFWEALFDVRPASIMRNLWISMLLWE